MVSAVSPADKTALDRVYDDFTDIIAEVNGGDANPQINKAIKQFGTPDLAKTMLADTLRDLQLASGESDAVMADFRRTFAAEEASGAVYPAKFYNHITPFLQNHPKLMAAFVDLGPTLEMRNALRAADVILAEFMGALNQSMVPVTQANGCYTPAELALHEKLLSQQLKDRTYASERVRLFSNAETAALHAGKTVADAQQIGIKAAFASASDLSGHNKRFFDPAVVIYAEDFFAQKQISTATHIVGDAARFNAVSAGREAVIRAIADGTLVKLAAAQAPATTPNPLQVDLAGGEADFKSSSTASPITLATSPAVAHTSSAPAENTRAVPAATQAARFAALSPLEKMRTTQAAMDDRDRHAAMKDGLNHADKIPTWADYKKFPEFHSSYTAAEINAFAKKVTDDAKTQATDKKLAVAGLSLGKYKVTLHPAEKINLDKQARVEYGQANWLKEPQQKISLQPARQAEATFQTVAQQMAASSAAATQLAHGQPVGPQRPPAPNL